MSYSFFIRVIHKLESIVRISPHPALFCNRNLNKPKKIKNPDIKVFKF